MDHAALAAAIRAVQSRRSVHESVLLLRSAAEAYGTARVGERQAGSSQSPSSASLPNLHIRAAAGGRQLPQHHWHHSHHHRQLFCVGATAATSAALAQARSSSRSRRPPATATALQRRRTRAPVIGLGRRAGAATSTSPSWWSSNRALGKLQRSSCDRQRSSNTDGGGSRIGSRAAAAAGIPSHGEVARAAAAAFSRPVAAPTPSLTLDDALELLRLLRMNSAAAHGDCSSSVIPAGGVKQEHAGDPGPPSSSSSSSSSVSGGGSASDALAAPGAHPLSGSSADLVIQRWNTQEIYATAVKWVALQRTAVAHTALSDSVTHHVRAAFHFLIQRQLIGRALVLYHLLSDLGLHLQRVDLRLLLGNLMYDSANATGDPPPAHLFRDTSPEHSMWIRRNAWRAGSGSPAHLQLLVATAHAINQDEAMNAAASSAFQEQVTAADDVGDDDDDGVGGGGGGSLAGTRGEPSGLLSGTQVPPLSRWLTYERAMGNIDPFDFEEPRQAAATKTEAPVAVKAVTASAGPEMDKEVRAVAFQVSQRRVLGAARHLCNLGSWRVALHLVTCYQASHFMQRREDLLDAHSAIIDALVAGCCWRGALAFVGVQQKQLRAMAQKEFLEHGTTREDAEWLEHVAANDYMWTVPAGYVEQQHLERLAALVVREFAMRDGGRIFARWWQDSGARQRASDPPPPLLLRRLHTPSALATAAALLPLLAVHGRRSWRSVLEVLSPPRGRGAAAAAAGAPSMLPVSATTKAQALVMVAVRLAASPTTARTSSGSDSGRNGNGREAAEAVAKRASMAVQCLSKAIVERAHIHSPRVPYSTASSHPSLLVQQSAVLLPFIIDGAITSAIERLAVGTGDIGGALSLIARQARSNRCGAEAHTLHLLRVASALFGRAAATRAGSNRRGLPGPRPRPPHPMDVASAFVDVFTAKPRPGAPQRRLLPTVVSESQAAAGDVMAAATHSVPLADFCAFFFSSAFSTLSYCLGALRRFGEKATRHRLPRHEHQRATELRNATARVLKVVLSRVVTNTTTITSNNDPEKMQCGCGAAYTLQPARRRSRSRPSPLSVISRRGLVRLRHHYRLLVVKPLATLRDAEAREVLLELFPISFRLQVQEVLRCSRTPPPQGVIVHLPRFGPQGQLLAAEEQNGGSSIPTAPARREGLAGGRRSELQGMHELRSIYAHPSKSTDARFIYELNGARQRTRVVPPPAFDPATREGPILPDPDWCDTAHLSERRAVRVVRGALRRALYDSDAFSRHIVAALHPVSQCQLPATSSAVTIEPPAAPAAAWADAMSLFKVALHRFHAYPKRHTPCDPGGTRRSNACLTFAAFAAGISAVADTCPDPWLHAIALFWSAVDHGVPSGRIAQAAASAAPPPVNDVVAALSGPLQRALAKSGRFRDAALLRQRTGMSSQERDAAAEPRRGIGQHTSGGGGGGSFAPDDDAAVAMQLLLDDEDRIPNARRAAVSSPSAAGTGTGEGAPAVSRVALDEINARVAQWHAQDPSSPHSSSSRQRAPIDTAPLVNVHHRQRWRRNAPAQVSASDDAAKLENPESNTVEEAQAQPKQTWWMVALQQLRLPDSPLGPAAAAQRTAEARVQGEAVVLRLLRAVAQHASWDAAARHFFACVPPTSESGHPLLSAAAWGTFINITTRATSGNHARALLRVREAQMEAQQQRQQQRSDQPRPRRSVPPPPPWDLLCDIALMKHLLPARGDSLWRDALLVARSALGIAGDVDLNDSSTWIEAVQRSPYSPERQRLLAAAVKACGKKRRWREAIFLYTFFTADAGSEAQPPQPPLRGAGGRGGVYGSESVDHMRRSLVTISLMASRVGVDLTRMLDAAGSDGDAPTGAPTGA